MREGTQTNNDDNSKTHSKKKIKVNIKMTVDWS